MRGLLERLLARRRETASDGVPDSELLRRFVQARDEAAFELLVWRHGGMVLGLCRRALRDEQLAEDAFQAVFLVLARKAGAVRGNLGGWLFKVARRVAARATGKRPNLLPVVEEAAEPTDSAEREELSALLDAEIARLPDRLRRVVVLCYLGGHSTEDAARELGCPRGTVLSRLATARKHLADRLARRGVTLPAALVVGLSAQLVSSAAAAASKFRAGSLASSFATQLADGVLHTMRRVTLLTAAGVICAAALATGIGWVAAQPGPKPEPAASAERTAPPAAPKPAEPPPAALKPEQPNPPDARRDADERLKKLERLADNLRSEIEAHEKAIELLAKSGKDEMRLADLQHQLAEVEEEYRRANREHDRLASEATVLKKQTEDKNAFRPDPELLEQAVKGHTDLRDAIAARDRARDTLSRGTQLTPNDELLIIKLKAELAGAEKQVEEVRKRVTAELVDFQRLEEWIPIRTRLKKLELELKIKAEIRDKLRAELDTLKKQVSQQAGGANVAELRKALDPQREVLARVQREILLLRAQRDGVTFTEATGTDAKLDLILKELAVLRKEVQELKAQKK